MPPTPASSKKTKKAARSHDGEEKKRSAIENIKELEEMDMQENTTPTHQGKEKKKESAKKKERAKKRTSSVLDSTNAIENIKELEEMDMQENTTPTHQGKEKKKENAKKKERAKKRTSSVLDSTDDTINEEIPEYNLDGPTIGEKLASLDLINRDNERNGPEEQTLSIAPPSADSVHILLKQALRADDNASLLTCLYNRDEKVIAKSISLLAPADVVKLLKFFVSQIQSRGAVLVCILPWLQTLLTRHMSSIVSQESSRSLLNSLYQLIDARTSTFKSALQLSTTLDYLFSEIADDEADDEEVPPPIIYEDKDTDDEDSEVDAMETDGEEAEELGDVTDASAHSDGSEIMSD